jgi:hypothetical protein
VTGCDEKESARLEGGCVGEGSIPNPEARPGVCVCVCVCMCVQRSPHEV